MQMQTNEWLKAKIDIKLYNWLTDMDMKWITDSVISFLNHLKTSINSFNRWQISH